MSFGKFGFEEEAGEERVELWKGEEGRVSFCFEGVLRRKRRERRETKGGGGLGEGHSLDAG